MRRARPVLTVVIIRAGFVAALAALVAATLLDGCIPRWSDECSRKTDCAGGAFCNGNGFCESECSRDPDCPCGSFCAVSCGICVRVDLAGPATCHPFRRGLSTDDVLGACRSDVEGRRPNAGSATSASEDAESEAGRAEAADAAPGTCNGPPPTLPACTASPPKDSGPVSDGDTDGDDDADAAEMDAVSDAADAADAASEAATDANGGGDQ